MESILSAPLRFLQPEMERQGQILEMTRRDATSSLSGGEWPSLQRETVRRRESRHERFMANAGFHCRRHAVRRLLPDTVCGEGGITNRYIITLLIN